MTSQQTGESTLLHVAHPRECNTQQTAQTLQQPGATAVQHTSLKALALLALGRNNARNNHATDGEKATQQTAFSAEAFVARVLPDSDLRTHLQQLAAQEGIDPELIRALDDDDAAACAGWASSFAESLLRERGLVPLDETARVRCKHCGEVWVAPETAAVADIVNGMPTLKSCLWCFVQNRNFPRPPMEP